MKNLIIKLVCLFITVLVASCDKWEYEYYPSGKIRKKYQIDEGKVNGEYQEYYETGNLLVKSYYKNGKENGEVVFYYPSGQIEKQMRFVDGVQQDTMIAYYDNGVIEEASFVVDDKRNGVYEYYHPNGQLKSTGITRDNFEEGQWFYYDSLGTLLKRNYFFDKRLLSSFVYDLEGKVYTHYIGQYKGHLPQRWEVSYEDLSKVAFYDQTAKSGQDIKSITIQLAEANLNALVHFSKVEAELKGLDKSLLKGKVGKSVILNKESYYVDFHFTLNGVETVSRVSVVQLGSHSLIFSFICSKSSYDKELHLYEAILETIEWELAPVS